MAERMAFEEYYEELKSAVAALASDRHCLAFIVSCCERNLPNYAAFHSRVGGGDTPKLKAFVDRLWLHLKGENIQSSALDLMREEAEQLAICTEALDDNTKFPTFAVADHACSLVMHAANFLLSKDLRNVIGAGLDSLSATTDEVYWERVVALEEEKGSGWIYENRNSDEYSSYVKRFKEEANQDLRAHRELNKQLSLLLLIREMDPCDSAAIDTLRAMSSFDGRSSLGYRLE